MSRFIWPLILAASCGSSPLTWAAEDRPLRFLLDQAPLTLNPRRALDAASQRLSALLFQGLTVIDQNLQPQPGLATHWERSANGLRWTFTLLTDAKDQGGTPITAEAFQACLENYLDGPKPSPLQQAFPGWVRARAVSPTKLHIDLKSPDPYLPSNLASLRYFRLRGQGAPCVEPGEKTSEKDWIGSGPYRVPQRLDDQTPEIQLEPARPGWIPVVFRVVKDESTRALILLRGEADAAQNTLSLAKTRWLLEGRKPSFATLEREGVNVSYLAFDFQNPWLAKREVRQALAQAIPRDQIIAHKMFGYGSRAETFLAPQLRESYSVPPLLFDPANSARLLDQVGLKKDANGVRLRLRYRTTPVREGFETALILQEVWRKIGVEVSLDIVEPGVFLTSIRKGGFDLYSSRWVGVADASILRRSLRTAQNNNRIRYSNPDLDLALDQTIEATDERRRREAIEKSLRTMAHDLPYFPLWFWKNALLYRKDSALLARLQPKDLSLSGSYETLLRRLSELAAAPTSQSVIEKPK